MNVVELSMRVLEQSGPGVAGTGTSRGGTLPMAHSVGGEALAGVMPHHAAALLVPLLLPLVVGVFFGVVELATWANLPIARRFLRGYELSSPLTRMTALLLVLVGAAAYLVELVALGMVWIPRGSAPDRRVRDVALVDGEVCADRARLGDELSVASRE